jgi:hypothetical protein
MLISSLEQNLLEELIVSDMIKKFCSYVGTTKFITVFTRARYWTLSWVRLIQPKPWHTVSPPCRLSVCPIYLSNLYIYLWLYSSLLGLGRFFSSLIFYTAGRNSWTGVQPVARPLPSQRAAWAQNKRTQTFMLQVGFEPTIPVFGRAKTVHYLDGAVTVIGPYTPGPPKLSLPFKLSDSLFCKLRLLQAPYVLVSNTSSGAEPLNHAHRRPQRY